jgi:hypothetical protein
MTAPIKLNKALQILKDDYLKRKIELASKKITLPTASSDVFSNKLNPDYFGPFPSKYLVKPGNIYTGYPSGR